MPSIRAQGVPLFVTVVAILLGLFATAIGVTAFLTGAAMGGITGDGATTWAGRNTGLGVVLLVAVALRNPSGYVVAFAGQVLREVSDALSALPDGGAAAAVGAMVLLDLVCLALSVRAVRRAGPMTGATPARPSSTSIV